LARHALRTRLSAARRRELLRGPLIYVMAMVFATVVFWRNSPVGVVAISLMCGGDGAC
jgi:phytol kinase